MTSSAHSISHLKQLAGVLSKEHSLEQYSREHRLAAVLILAYPGKNEAEIILTRRSNNLPNHAGQISFPGGTVEDTDTDLFHTALREAREEISLNAVEVEIMGVLEVTTLPSGFVVAPVLGVMDKLPELTANPDEVEEIFSIPLSLVSNLDEYGEDFLVREGVRRDFFYLNYRQHYIWGATARMLRNLAELLGTDSNS